MDSSAPFLILGSVFIWDFLDKSLLFPAYSSTSPQPIGFIVS